MQVRAFDHVNVRTADVDRMVAWYDRVLGMKAGPRPPFPFPGAWLYLGEHALVHLVGVGSAPDAPESAIRLEHFAFSGSGLAAFLDHLRREGVEWRLGTTPGAPPTGGIVQVNIFDPDGNHIHVDFAGEPIPAGAQG